MKLLNKACAMLFFFAMVSCDPLYHIGMINNSDETVYIVSPEFNCISIYPDTLLPNGIDIQFSFKLRSKDTVFFTEDMGYWDYDSFFCDNDTLSIYIFNADSVEFYSFDTIVKYNMVLQRYDFSREDIENLYETFTYFAKWIYFPPTEEMKHIHMWPPYGTYDEQGRRRKGK